MFNIKKLLPLFAGLVIFFLAAIYLTYPLIFNLNSYTTGFGDELLITWIQNHAIHSLIHAPLQLFNGNIFYPYQNTIAYSDLFLTSSILASPFVYFFKEPITAINFTLFSSIFTLGFCVFLLSYYLTKNFLSSVISGLLVIFSPAVLDKKVHLQILAIEWIPLAMLFFIHFLKTKKSKWLVMAMFFFVIQTANSFLPGYFLLFFFAICLFILFIEDRNKLKLFFQKNNLAIIIVSFLILLPIFIPYIKVSSQFNFKRDIKDSIHFALQPEDLLVAGNDSKMQNILPQNFRVDKFNLGEIKPGFIGLAFSFLTLSSIVYFLKKKKKDFVSLSLLATGALGFVTSFGPAMHWGRATIHHPFLIPLPYALFYYLLPAFSGFRNSARWEILFILCFAVLIGIFLSNILKKQTQTKQFLAYLLIIGAVLWEFEYPMKFYRADSINNFPKVYSYVSSLKKPTIFLPACNWNDKCAGEEFKRVYYSISGFPQMVNGTSGFSSTAWQREIQEINKEFPNERSLNLIKQSGGKYVVFEKDTWDRYFQENIQNALLHSKDLILIKKFDNTYVFKLL